MRNQTIRFLFFVAGTLALSLPAGAQVYYPRGRSPEQKKAAEASKATLKYDPHDLSGIWTHMGRVPDLPKYPGIGDAHGSQLMGGAEPPPLTFWGLAAFVSHKPSLETAWQSRRTIPALGNDPVGNCDPLGYPRAIERSAIEFVQTPSKVLQISRGTGYAQSVREIFLNNGNPAEWADQLGPRWDGWAVGHWEGDSFIVESTGYDERSWLDGNGWPHSENMKIREVYRHPDATTLELLMTIDDPKTYTKTWVGNKQMFRLELPKDRTILYEELCVPSEEQEFNRGVRNPAGGDLQHSRPLY
jgi:hypothetical protein